MTSEHRVPARWRIPQRAAAWLVAATLAAASVPVARAQAAAYDPLRAIEGAGPQTHDLVVDNPQRRRAIPLRVYLPAGASERGAAPVVLFSHGLGGSRDGSAFLGRHWAARGYVAVFLQHPGSDDSVWKDEAKHARMRAMRRAASAENFLLRVKDVAVVLDQLEAWNRTPAHVLSARLDPTRVGMSGHSFGAVTSQAVGGQVFATDGNSFTDRRIKAVIAFSPSSPRRGDPQHAFASVAIPWMLMTGTKDAGLVGDSDAASRLAVFPALPAGSKYELVLNNAEHSAFSDRPLPGDREPRNPNHHRVMLALSTAFWDATLRGDAAARAWLDGAGATRLLETGDRWQKK